MARKTRAYIVVRQSRTIDGSQSAPEQIRLAREGCERDHVLVVGVGIELDTSGKTPLAKRRGKGGESGLLDAVEAVESGAADEIRVAYFDRLCRSLKVQTEVFERVGAAGGRVLAGDTGELSYKTANGKLTAQMLGSVNEYWADAAGERTAAHKQAAIDRGVPPFPFLALGLRKVYAKRDGREVCVGVEHDPVMAPLVVTAFAMRADGKSARTIREWLVGQGVEITVTKVEKLLRSRQVRGELHFGTFRPNLTAWPPIVSEETWRRAQANKARGGRPVGVSSTRLLSKLGVAVCHKCTSRLSLGGSGASKRFVTFGCFNPDCTERVSISADVLEAVTLSCVERIAADFRGRHDHDRELEVLRRDAEHAQIAFEDFAMTLAGRKTTERLAAELQRLEDEWTTKQDAYEDLRAIVAPIFEAPLSELLAGNVDAQRRAIRLALDRVVVKPRAASRIVQDRIEVWARGDDAPMPLVAG